MSRFRRVVAAFVTVAFITSATGGVHAQALAGASAPDPAALQPDDTDDGDEDDGWDEDDGDGASMKAPPGKEAGNGYTVRLTGLRMGSVGKPMPVAVWASGGGEVANATIAVRFDEKVLRALKVESTGLFDGKLGAGVEHAGEDDLLRTRGDVDEAAGAGRHMRPEGKLRHVDGTAAVDLQEGKQRGVEAGTLEVGELVGRRHEGVSV